MLGRAIFRKLQGERKQTKLLVNHTGRGLAVRILQLQVVLLTLICTAALLGWGWRFSQAACWGGVCAIIPFAIFARLAFALTGARAAQLTIRAFYLGEALKILTSLSLLVVGLAVLRLNAESLLISFALTLVPVWVGPLILKTTNK